MMFFICLSVRLNVRSSAASAEHRQHYCVASASAATKSVPCFLPVMNSTKSFPVKFMVTAEFSPSFRNCDALVSIGKCNSKPVGVDLMRHQTGKWSFV